MANQTHLFALAITTPLPNNLVPDSQLTLTDTDLLHRVTTVLRLGIGEQLILFDQQQTVTLELTQLTKKTLTGVVHSAIPITQPLPKIKLYIGLPKREAFESIVYSAGQLGVASIIPVITQKTHRNWITSKDHDRLLRIALAGCEQAKQFVIPELRTPVNFTQAITDATPAVGFVCDVMGAPAITAHGQPADTPLDLWIGPEGGFTVEELAALIAAGIAPLRLTPTILRSQDAVLAALAILRA